ncbi:hypothetical protein SVA_1125 [Sulfurifustis variabilis]|uniref:Uncharacterized protein n=1 Tax=Sulfurifustis variabilis TaxID=1675686 RepID=A0A1B4VB98_9GAMM|nr:PilC/PilY family type IV pilus protein [Sulfurifustis variabilis]BAU47701.1 hypothetical protein SVA_1125 [Sulfurifustis variabilis]
MANKRTLLALFIGAALGYSSVGLSLDTDIYLEPPGVSRDDAPNVLIIFDNSSSMAGNNVTTAPAYDPNTVYAYAGDPGDAFVADRLYWIDEDNNQSEPTSATSYPDQWIPPDNNRCESSGLPWHVDKTTDRNGQGTATFYAAMSAQSWTKNWSALTPDPTGVVDCKQDHDNAVADAEDTGSKWLENKSNGYTNQTANGKRLATWAQYTFFTGNYLNYRSQSVTVTESRLSVAKRVTKQIIDSNPGVNFGLMLFHGNNPTPDGGYVAMAIGKQNDTVTYNATSMTRKAAIKAMIDDVNPNAYGPACDGSPSEPSNCNSPYVGTPLAETMYEAKLYLSGDTPKYGYAASTAPTPPPDATAKGADGKYVSPFRYTCQQAYIILVTDGNPWVTNDTNADDEIDLLTNIGTFDDGYTYGYSSKLDELARWMYTQDLIDDDILENNQRAITYTIGFDLKPGALDDDQKKDADGQQLLQDTASSSDGEYRSATNASELSGALQAALIDIQTTNSSFAAPALSVNAFNKLFNRDEVYFALFKPSGTKCWDGNVKKFKLCADKTNTTCSFGEIIDKNGTPAIDPVTQRIKDSATSYWTAAADGGDVTKGGAGGQIPAPAARKLYTYRGSYSGLSASSPATLTRIEVSGTNSVYTAAINDPTILGLTDTSADSATTNATDTAQVELVLKWMLGYDVYDKDQDGSTTDERWRHGDPLHSRPVAITYGGTSSDPVIKLFYASNDGVVRIVNDYNGAEEWAFVPSELLNKQFENAQDSVGTHLYGMDGTPTFWIQDNNNNGIIEPDNNDHVYMYIGMRRGGNNIYAFDVTPTAALDDPAYTSGISPKLMWVIRGGPSGDTAYRRLGQTWSKPAVARIRFGCSGAGCETADDSSAKTVLIFGGGYDPSEDDVMPVQAAATAANKIGNAIYVVDPETGERLWWASDGPDSAGNSPTLTLSNMKFGIPSDLALMDSNRDGEVDRIYVGDTGGQLWRIDLGPTLKTNSNGNSKGFVFADVGCTGNNPATDRPNCATIDDYNRRKFFYPPDVAQVTDNQYVENAAESKYDLVAIATGDREDPLDKLTAGGDPVRNRIYAFRDRKIDTYAVSGSTLPTPLTEADLYDATSNVLQDPNGTDYAAALQAIKESDGWYVELKESGASAPTGAPSTWPWVGEKGLAKPVIFDGVLYVTTYVPANDLTAERTCSASEGLAKLHAFNFLNATAAVDFDKDGTLDRTIELGGGIPSETVIVIREDGVSSLVGTSGGAARPEINSKLPRFKTFWYEE